MTKIRLSDIVRVGKYRLGRVFGSTDYTPFIILSRSRTGSNFWLDRSICADDICRASVDDVYLYRDTGHLANTGSAWLGENPAFRAALAQALDTP